MGYSNIGSIGGGTPIPPNNIENFIVGDNSVGQYKVVYKTNTCKIQEASSSNKNHSSVIGITLDSGNPGETCRVVKFSKISNPSWNLNIGQRYYLGENGNLILNAPTTGFVLEVGLATSTTELEIQNLDDVIVIE